MRVLDSPTMMLKCHMNGYTELANYTLRYPHPLGLEHLAITNILLVSDYK